MRPAEQTRGCSFAQIYVCADDERRIEYVEDWDDPGELREQLSSERFVWLLGLLETAAEPPVVQFRFISKTHGLEYVAAAGTALASKEQ